MKERIMWAVPWRGLSGASLDIEKLGAWGVFDHRDTAKEQEAAWGSDPIKVAVTIRVVKEAKR